MRSFVLSSLAKQTGTLLANTLDEDQSTLTLPAFEPSYHCDEFWAIAQQCRKFSRALVLKENNIVTTQKSK
jgi:hypothetical protein